MQYSNVLIKATLSISKSSFFENFYPLSYFLIVSFVQKVEERPFMVYAGSSAEIVGSRLIEIPKSPIFTFQSLKISKFYGFISP